MILIGRFSKTLVVVLVLTVTFFIYISCSTKDVNNNRGLKNANGDTYAGSVVCANCHSNIYNSFLNNAHFHTSSLPTEENIKGSFLSESNVFVYDYSTFMLMEHRNNKFFETEYHNGKLSKSESIYVVIGSGTRGQSYLYKGDSQLYQLPVSYFTNSNSWSNSPGFPFYEPRFSRHITYRCMECHSTYTDLSKINVTDKNNNPKNMIMGVECESCHGAAQKHVDFHEQNPNTKQARFIINPSKLTRAQKIELCSYCHAQGKVVTSAKPFTFKPGDSLKRFLRVDTVAADTSHIDVHGNQAALLSLSKCFKMSTLDCTTCHDTHKQERGDLQLFSNRCMNCHNETHNSFCKLTVLSKNVLKNNCIDCHMPAKQSKVLTVNLNQTNIKTPAVIRSHFITFYPDETKKFIQKEIQHSDN